MEKVKKFIATWVVVLMCFSACTNKMQRPKLTLQEYNLQAETAQGTIDKILNESDHLRMHEIAKAIENSRAINCTAITDECNVLSKILNKIVSASKDSLPKQADNIEIYNLIHELRVELKKGQEILKEQWSHYNKQQGELSRI